MIKIAICDDDVFELAHIKREICEIAEKLSVEAGVTAFSSSVDILRAIENDANTYDMLFLDMYIDEKLGLDIAGAVRAVNKRCVIIFITGFSDKMADCFELRASAYIIKPIEREKLMSAFAVGLEHLNGAPRFLVSLKNVEHSIPFDEIMYFESSLKNIKLFRAGAGEPVVFPGSIYGVGAPAEFFFMCHTSFLVNFSYVSMLDKSGHDLVLKNGARIHISRKFYSDIVTEFTRFHSKKRG